MRADLLELFDLDPALTHLNHGSFGAVPSSVREAQERARADVERAPMRAYRDHLPGQIASARRHVERFLGAQTDSVALVRNVTEGIGVVLDTLGIDSRHDVVVSNHGYGTVPFNIDARGAWANVATFETTDDEDAVVAAFQAAVTPITRLVIVDQVTSPTALVLPVRRIAEAVAPIPVLIDAAHVPGQLVHPDPGGLGAAFWVGNLHKWAFAPRSVAALWVASRYRERVYPRVVSWSWEEGFPASFDLNGTVDHSSTLAVPQALRFWHEHVGEQGVAAQSEVLRTGAQVVQEALGTRPVHAEGGLASAPLMTVVALPPGVADTPEAAHDLWQRLWQAGFVVAPICHDGRGYLRLTAAPYNDAGDYERLATWLGCELRA